MSQQKLFRHSFIDALRRDLAKNKGVDRYLRKNFKFLEEDVLSNPTIVEPAGLKLKVPVNANKYDLENSKILFEAYKDLTRIQATDSRFWTYLSHVTYWDYMNRRNPIKLQHDDKKSKYILEHWFLNGLNPNTLFRQGISMLWWGAFLTYDSSLDDPYKLTKELFSMLDYTRTLVTSMQGRNNVFTRALLKYVLKNPRVFSSHKETKVRLLAKYMNRKGGHILLPTLTEPELLAMFKKYEPELMKVTGRESLHKL